jgi:hypothetical protein
MATCAILGQAVGTAAAIAVRDRLLPRGVYRKGIKELQQTLMEDDCYLPWKARQVPALTQEASLTASEGDPEPLRNGLDRPIGETDNGWTGGVGSWVQYTFEGVTRVRGMRFVFDSDLNRPEKNMPSSYPLHIEPVGVPETLVRAFRVEAQDENGEWRAVLREESNHQRLVQLDLNVWARAVRFIPEATWGAERAHLFAWDVRA